MSNISPTEVVEQVFAHYVILEGVRTVWKRRGVRKLCHWYITLEADKANLPKRLSVKCSGYQYAASAVIVATRIFAVPLPSQAQHDPPRSPLQCSILLVMKNYKPRTGLDVPFC
jgi:hypothetical protein